MSTEQRQDAFRMLFAANAILFVFGAIGVTLAYYGFELIGVGLFILASLGGCVALAVFLDRFGRSGNDPSAQIKRPGKTRKRAQAGQ